MIKTIQTGDFSIFLTDDKYRELFRLCRSGDLTGTVLQHTHSTYQERLTMKVSWNGTDYIVKHMKQKKHRFEGFFTHRIRGSYAQHLIRQVDKATMDGALFTPAIHLVAEERHSFQEGYNVWYIIEFIDGKTLNLVEQPPAGYQDTLKRLLSAAHRYHLVSHDPHAGNFMFMPDGQARIIDLAGKPYTRFRAAMDRLMFEFKIGGTFPPHDLYYWICRIIYLFRRRRWSRRKYIARKKSVTPTPPPDAMT